MGPQHTQRGDPVWSSTVGYVLAISMVVSGAEARAADPVLAEKMGPFLAKNRPCYAWAYARFSMAPRLTSGEVFCIFDGVEHEGTVDEVKGCMVARYSATTNTYDDDDNPLLPTWEAPCSPKFVALLFTDKRFQNGAINFLGSIVGSNLIEVGGAGGFALGRVLCSEVRGINGLDCDSFTEQAEVAAKQSTKAASTKGAKKPPEAEEKVPEPAWLKKR